MVTVKSTTMSKPAEDEAAPEGAASAPEVVAPVEKVNGPTGETEVDPRVAGLEAELEQLRAQLASAKPDPLDAPDGYVWVVAADGGPIQGVPYAPRGWLGGVLLPAGAREATAAERERLQAVEAARHRPQL